ncbi:MAG: hypothetical protein ACJAVV_003726 [Alphaproteobacteria bacterium]|jgi:hypothetical protein
MKYFSLLFIFLSLILHSSVSFSSTADLSIEKVDPDNIDPTMPFVIYNLGPKDLSIESYRQGKPSHFTLLLCKKCKEKIYKLNPEAELMFNQQAINKSDLALIVMKKNFNYITITINRSTNSIDFLTFDAVRKSEFEQLQLQ